MTRSHIIKDVKQWPVFRMGRDRERFIDLSNKASVQNLLDAKDGIESLIEKTIYLEKLRVKNNPWSVDPNDEKQYWEELHKSFTKARTLEDPDPELKEILARIVNRYNQEIVGNFKEKTFRFARKALTVFFKTLHNTFFTNILKGPWGNRSVLLEKIRVVGPLDKVRKLFPNTTMIILPTHQSNIDSILVGYTIEMKMGLPAFVYGAGLNLYNSEMAAYFMNRLGTYKVDRRKRNPIYLECLKSVVSTMTQDNINNLFFPGGTRSRDGRIESKLKLGLLGSVLETQRNIFIDGSDKKIVIVPVVTNYNFVLEGKSLIDQYLRRTARQKYTKSKHQVKSSWFIWKFVRDLFRKESSYVFSIGEPMDVFGNLVDEEGRSVDAQGDEIDIKGYFSLEGELNATDQREKVYTKHLGAKVAESYQKNYVVLASHLVAYTAFDMLTKQNSTLELYDVLNLDKEDLAIAKEEFIQVLAKHKERLLELEQEGEIKVTKEVRTLDPVEILDMGLKNLGHFHATKVLYMKDGIVSSEDFRLLYYYYNRLDSHHKFVGRQDTTVQEEILKKI